MIYSLENKFLRFSLDEKGRLLELVNIHSGHDYAGGGDIWEIIAECDGDLEMQIKADSCSPEIKREDENSLSLKYERICSEDDRYFACSLLIKIFLIDDEIRSEVEIDNQSPEIIVREIHYPVINKPRLKDGQEFIWSHLGGEKFSYEDIFEEIKKCHTQYKTCDHDGVQMGSMYPGSFAALNFFMFANSEEGLYLGSHDAKFQNTLHLLKLKDDNLSASFVKYPFLKEGQKTRETGYVLSLYNGSWRYAAGKYKSWTDSWFQRTQPLEWVEQLNGWQRIIMKHQYGKKYYGYDDIPEIFKDGAEAGIDALMMFGWTKYGHDNLYPLYDADESQGGEEKLKEKIAEFKNAGGRVILYFNGRLIDVGSDYYKNIGKKICIKDENGYETLEQYPFAGNGSASRWFGCKTFVSACPTSEEWFGILESCVEKADALGVDSIFFDQMGICEKICHDPSHSHGSPCNDPGLRKAGLLKRLRQKAVNSNSKMALGIEALSDVTAQHADYIHNLTGGCSFSGNKIFGFLDLFRYVLPEVIVSDRDIRDDSDIERRVNHAAMKGLRSDVEIYRCRKTIKETPHYKEYLSRINALRSKYSDVLLEGAYCDAEGFYLSDRNVAARRFEGKTRDAIVVTQSAEDSIVFELDYDCGEYLFCDGIGIIEALEAGEKTLKLQLSKNALAVLIFGKK